MKKGEIQWLKRSKVILNFRFQPAMQTPAPPVGPALGQHGVNIMDFCKQFNAKTQDQPGMIIPVVITVYADRLVFIHLQNTAGSSIAKEGSRS